MADLVVGISGPQGPAATPRTAWSPTPSGPRIAVAVYDPAAKVGGLLHYMLPDSTLDARQGEGDTRHVRRHGHPASGSSPAHKMGADKKRMVVKVAGGASILDESNFFRIGQKNIMAMRKLFWSNNVLIDAEDTGKNFQSAPCGSISARGSSISKGGRAARWRSYEDQQTDSEVHQGAPALPGDDSEGDGAGERSPTRRSRSWLP